MSASSEPPAPAAGPRSPGRARPSNLVIVLGGLVVVLAGLLAISVLGDDDAATSTTPAAATTEAPGGAGVSDTASASGSAGTTGAPAVGGDMATVMTAPPPTATLPPTTATSTSTAAPSTAADTTSVTPAPGPTIVAAVEVDRIADTGAVGDDVAWVLAADGTGSLSTDGGATWRSLDLPAGSTSLTFADASHGWATTTPAGWWSTHDGGATWNDLGISGEVPSGDPIAADISAGHVFAAVGLADGLHLMLSPIDRDDPVDLGVTVPYGAGPVFDVSMAARGEAAWVVSNDRTVVGGILVEDGTVDASWLPPAADAFGPVRIVAAEGSSLLWAVASTNQWGGDSEPLARVYLSLEGGTVWQELSGPPGVGAVLAAGASPGAGVPTLVVGVGPVLYSTDVQKLSDPPVWDEVADLSADGASAITSVVVPAAGVIDVSVIAGDHEEIWRSADGGSTWQTLVRAAA